MSVEAHANPRYKWKVLGCVMFGVFMVVLHTTVLNVALREGLQAVPAA